MITVYGLSTAPSVELITAANNADLVVGGRRHLDVLEVPEEKRVVLGQIGPAIEKMAASQDSQIVVVASGDPLFYGVVRRIRAAGLKLRVIPALTSLQLAFAAVALPWDDALLVSAHGNDPSLAFEACRTHPKVGVLTDPTNNLAAIVNATSGLGKSYVVAQQLGSPDEQVVVLDETQAANYQPASPYVVLVLAYSPDDPRALGEQGAISGGRR